MKTLIILCVITTLVGCSTQTTEISNSYELPEGLKDCKVYYMQSKQEQSLTVLRCQNSQTNVHYSKPEGKSARHYNTTTVEN